MKYLLGFILAALGGVAAIFFMIAWHHGFDAAWFALTAFFFASTTGGL